MTNEARAESIKWIPSSEREPEKDGDYLVCFDDGYIATVTYIHKGWETWSDAGEVAAWMELPEPYEAESEVK